MRFTYERFIFIETLSTKQDCSRHRASANSGPVTTTFEASITGGAGLGGSGLGGSTLGGSILGGSGLGGSGLGRFCGI